MKAPFSRPLGDENDKFIFGVSFFGGIVGILGSGLSVMHIPNRWNFWVGRICHHCG